MTYSLVQPGAPYFKAMKTEEIKEMRQRFVNIINMRAGDDYYIRMLKAKQNGTTAEPKKVTIKKEPFTSYNDVDTTALGATRLKRTTESQPLQTDENVKIPYFLPICENEMLIEKLWAHIIELDVINHSAKPDEARFNNILRYCVHQIRLDLSSEFSDEGKPENHKTFAYLINCAKGQSFLLRLMSFLPKFYMKRLFFTTFIILKEVKVSDSSSFATEFLKALMEFLRSTKPKWVAAFIRESTRNGFKAIAEDRFRLALVATIASKARRLRAQKGTKPEEELLLSNNLSLLGDAIERDRTSLTQGGYDPVFMDILIRSVLVVCTAKSKLVSILWQA